MTTASTQNIHQRLAAVMQEVDYLQKKKKVETYMAVTHDQVTGELRPWFLAHGIAIETSLVSSQTVNTGQTSSKGTPMVRFEGVFDVAFINIDDPADRSVLRLPAHANDYGDKAPGKAVSYVTKTAMLKKLMIETGENDESRVHDEGISAERIVEIEQGFKNCTDVETLRNAVTAAMAEAKESNDSYAFKRFRENGEKRARELGAPPKQQAEQPKNEFMPAATTKTVDTETGDVKDATPPAAAAAPQPTAAPSQEGAGVATAAATTKQPEPPAGDLKLASDGMKRTVGSAMKRTGKTAEQLKEKYGFDLASMPFAKTNDVLSWARAS